MSIFIQLLLFNLIRYISFSCVSSDSTQTVTIRNDIARRAQDGSYVDAHAGCILEHNGTYFLYGESYGNQTLATPYPWSNHPRLAVYTSQNLVNWTYRGPVLTRKQVPGTLWIPRVIFDDKTQTFILWFGSGGWGTATSKDGINFIPATLKQYSRFGANAGTDGTGVFIDDDGIGYIAFASNPPNIDIHGHPWPGHPNALGYGHLISIERLSPDYLTSTKVNVSNFFPDDYVESPSLFKRNGIYYITYGSCCCGCSEGSGQVVFQSRSIHGPWKRQNPQSDINCMNSSEPICGGYGLRSHQLKNLVHHAQWWGPSFITLANGDELIMFLGRQWLSGVNHPAGCKDICGNGGRRDLCRDTVYELRSDLSVWYPLEFDSEGNILVMHSLPSFQLSLPTFPAMD